MTEREEFEAWWNSHARELWEVGEVQGLWMAWQAARASSEAKAARPKFDKTYCSQCDGEFGPGDHGYSHCSDHAPAQPEAVEDGWLALGGPAPVAGGSAPAQPFPPENTYDPPRPQGANYKPAQPVAEGWKAITCPWCGESWAEPPAQPAGELD